MARRLRPTRSCLTTCARLPTATPSRSIRARTAALRRGSVASAEPRHPVQRAHHRYQQRCCSAQKAQRTGQPALCHHRQPAPQGLWRRQLGPVPERRRLPQAAPVAEELQSPRCQALDRAGASRDRCSQACRASRCTHHGARSPPGRTHTRQPRRPALLGFMNFNKIRL
jgi:hypothetical protein